MFVIQDFCIILNVDIVLVFVVSEEFVFSIVLLFVVLFFVFLQSRYMSERKLEPKDVPGTFLNMVGTRGAPHVRAPPPSPLPPPPSSLTRRPC